MDDKLTFKAAVIQITLAFFANITCLSPGMGLAFPAITSELLLRDGPTQLTVDEVSWFSSITMFVCPVGGPISTFLVNKFGRKISLVSINVLSLVHWIIVGLSSKTNSQILFIELIIARIIKGLTVGMITAPVMMYATEISHVTLKSRLAVLSAPFFMSIGVLLIYFIGYLTGEDFRLASWIALGINIFGLILSLIIPESPVFLVVNKKIEAARKTFALLGHTYKNDPKIENQIAKIQTANNSSSLSSSPSILEQFRKPEFYKPLLITSAFFGIQQLSGIFTLFVLAAKFAIEAGVSIDAFLCAVIIGSLRVSLTFIMSFFINKFKRRHLAILSSSGMVFALIGLVICQTLTLKETSLSWLAAVFLLIFSFFGILGVLTLPFLYVTEVFQQSSRGLGIGLSTSICFIISFFTLKTFALFFEIFGAVAMFSFYMIMSIVGIFFSIFILPETNGKTSADMLEYFTKNIKS